MVKAGMRVALPLHPLELDFLARLYVLHIRTVHTTRQGGLGQGTREGKGGPGSDRRQVVDFTHIFLLDSSSARVDHRRKGKERQRRRRKREESDRGGEGNEILNVAAEMNPHFRTASSARDD